MSKIKLNLQEFGELLHKENIISINREVDVGEHLPQDIIGKGAEFTMLRNISNDEFKKLWEASNRVIKNMFIHSSDEIGIEKYIQLIDLEITGNLEEKRKKVFLEWNRQTIWTHRTLLQWMDIAVGKDKYKVNLYYNDYAIEFEFLIYKNILVDYMWLVKELRDIIPANLIFRFTVTAMQNIYVGAYGTSGHFIHSYPNEAEDMENEQNIYVAVYNIYNKLDIKSKAAINRYRDKDGDIWYYSQRTKDGDII